MGGQTLTGSNAYTGETTVTSGVLNAKGTGTVDEAGVGANVGVSTGPVPAVSGGGQVQRTDVDSLTKLKIEQKDVTIAAGARRGTRSRAGGGCRC